MPSPIVAPCIVITGASSGVGARLSERLAARGATVVAIARNRERLQALHAGSGRIVPIIADTADTAALPQVVAEIEASIGPIATLINNAAVYTAHEFTSQDATEIDRLIGTNLIGTMHLTRAVLPAMVARKTGRIINVASVAGTRGIPTEAIYCASKHGLLGFADALAQELVPHGITVCSICPGGIDTPLWSRTPGDGGQKYGGDLSGVMPVDEVCAWIEFALDRPPGTIPKRLVFFPTTEWH